VSGPRLPSAPPPLPRSPGDPRAIDEAVRLLARARRPVIFAGSQVWWDDATAALRALAERARIPVLVNGMARGALGAGHPQSFAAARRTALEKADVVVLVGVALDFRVGYGADIGRDAAIVQIERDPAELGKNRAAAVALLGDAASILGQLAETLPPDIAYAEWTAALRDEELRLLQRRADWERSAARPMNHYRFARAVADAVDDDTIVIGDGGDIVAITAKVLEPRQPGHWLDPGPLGCLGVGAPFALAAKKLHPGKKVLVVSGDGSFGLNGFDFESCVRLGLPVTVVVGNDAAWGQIRGPQVMTFGPGRAPATSLRPTRYDRVVEALGGRGEHIDDPAALAPAIRAALASEAVTCIDVSIDPDFMVREGLTKLTV